MNSKLPLTWIVLLGFMLGLTIAALSEAKPDYPNFAVGSAHEHASILVKIHDDPFDFSQERFQLRNAFVHLENNNGVVIHRHSQGITLGYFFETLNLGLTPKCLTLDDGREFCTNDDYTLKFYINEKRVDDIVDYITFEGDYILISYGDETQEQIKKQFKEQKEKGFPFQLRERNSNNLSNA